MNSNIARRIAFSLVAAAGLFVISPRSGAATPTIQATELVAPVEGEPKYPFTKDEAIRNGRWRRGSQDYPYFGAPRSNNARRHAGIDIYPPKGEDATVRAMAAGTIIKIAPFYTRSNGEVTYGILVDHGGFVANYAELKKPETKAGTAIGKGGLLGRVSGTKQLHLEFYSKGTRDWSSWYGKQPANLFDPTACAGDLLYDRPSRSGAPQD